MTENETLQGRKKILILTNDAGFGHRSASLAIKMALEMEHPGAVDVDIVNPLDHDKAPLVLKESQSDYDRIVRKAPELYDFGYKASDKLVPTYILEQGIMLGLFEVMRSLIREYTPDVIVTTHPLYTPATFAVLGVYKKYIPVIIVVTDLISVHRIWFNDKAEALIVPTEDVRDLAIDAGVAADKIHLIGIPVNPKLDRETVDKSAARKALGWDPDRFTVLISGSKRVEGLPEALHILNHFGKEMQLAIVCGRDTELYNELRAVEWHQMVHLYEFTKRMPDMMSASDLMICKAGGLSVTEALASGLPMILINVLPGQEVGNMEYVVRNGAGIHTESKDAILEALAHLNANGGKLLDEMAANSCRLGRSHAAFDAAEIIWDISHLNVGDKKLAEDANILNLLRLNRINWADYGKLESSSS